ncbi:MAG: PD-(D/E)XK nuclease family protein [Clostridiales bacterium]|nr:PD-(D/E)XK nuclease family protein [Clostridiales bacterium]
MRGGESEEGMVLQLILGGSGSGKTSRLYQIIIDRSIQYPEQLCFVIVPEQFTMQAQKDLVSLHPRHAMMNIDVVSFQRLAYRVFEELAVEQLEVLDDMGKSMVLRRVAAGCRRNLKLFQGHLSQTGFINQLKTTISEFCQYGITPQILRELAPRAATPLSRQKLDDLAEVFQYFEDYIAGHYITSEEVLDVLCRRLPESQLIRGSVIALDGYAGFMPVQYRLIELFLTCAREVYVTVTADPRVNVYRPAGMQELFAMSSQMVCRLTKLSENSPAGKREDIWVTECGWRAPELEHLEKNLFRPRREVFGKPPEGAIELYQAVTPAAEITRVVRRIRRMVVEEGLRYRDIAVVTGDLAGYGGEITRQFSQNHIPCFLDDKKNILDHPLVELIRAALETVRRDFSYESVFRCLRTGLMTDEREMTDRMENYVIALGIRGFSRWRESWERTYRGGANVNLVELNAFRDTVMAPLFALRAAFRGENAAASPDDGETANSGKNEVITRAGTSEDGPDSGHGGKLTVGERVTALREFLEACQIEERLERMRQDFAARDEFRLEKEYGQIYEVVMELLDRLEQLLGEECPGQKEFQEILDAGFAEISLGVIPATVDRVVVGDLTRTRLAHVKALFFVGVNDGIVPSRKEGGSLLSDQEREFFGAQQLELAPTAREDSFQQRFFLYRIMTKPERKLIVSFAMMGADGKSRRPSFLIGELRKLFPDLRCERREETPETDVYSVQEAFAVLADGLARLREGGEISPQLVEIYRYFAGNDSWRRDLRLLMDAAFYVYEKQGIGRAAARALYGKILSGSVTRLEQYAACAYGHFLKYGLELEERQRYELRAADIGNLFHDSIDLCFRKMREEGRDWRTVADGDREALVRACVEQVTAEYGSAILGSSSRNAWLAGRVEHMTQRTIWALQKQLCRGDFEPVGFEVSFTAADNLSALRIPLSEDEELRLRGRVDRLDLCEDDGRIYVKIIDYKSGRTAFDLTALYYGLQLQLVVYMDAVMELTKRANPDKEIVPAGILYYNIDDPLVDRDAAAPDGVQDKETIDREILRKLRMNGLVNSELAAIRHLDRSIEKESDIIPVVLKDEEVQEGRSSVANGARFEALRQFVRGRVKAAGREILDGETGVEPYRSGERTACDYCPYHAVCGFDRKTPGFSWRRLKSKKSEEIWEELCQ